MMDNCICIPVKRNYKKALFEMAVYDRRSVATPINFWSLISIDVKGFLSNVGRKVFTGFEMLDLESYTSKFFHYFIT